MPAASAAPSLQHHDRLAHLLLRLWTEKLAAGHLVGRKSARAGAGEYQQPCEQHTKRLADREDLRRYRSDRHEVGVGGGGEGEGSLTATQPADYT